jgi:hypothetical protein
MPVLHGCLARRTVRTQGLSFHGPLLYLGGHGGLWQWFRQHMLNVVLA